MYEREYSCFCVHVCFPPLVGANCGTRRGLSCSVGEQGWVRVVCVCVCVCFLCVFCVCVLCVCVCVLCVCVCVCVYVSVCVCAYVCVV